MTHDRGMSQILVEPARGDEKATDGRPPYRVPSMPEVAALRGSSGRRAVSTFSGCGGSCLGLEMAGFEVLWASEFVPAAREVYEMNHPGVPVDARDVRDVTPEDILAATGLAAGELDLLEGSPPCASFSTAGKRHNGWGQESKYSDTKQRTDDLFFEFARLLEGLQPRAFVAENVSGLVKGTAKGYFKMILRRLRECGYVVEARLLDAQWLGVPQMRQRLIFQGVRNDLGRSPAWPSPLPYRYSIRDALTGVAYVRVGGGTSRAAERYHDGPVPTIMAHGIGGVDRKGTQYDVVAVTGRTGPQFRRTESELDEPMNAITAGDPEQTRYEVVERVVHDTSGLYGHGDVTEQPSPTVTVGVNSVNSHHYQVEAAGALEFDPETGYRITLEGHAIAGEWDKLGEGESSERYFNLVRPHRDGPSSTVTMSAGGRGTAGVTHPVQRRKFTLGELRRICGFPDDFALAGSYQQRWERLGRAVPPPMMRAVAEAMLAGPLA